MPGQMKGQMVSKQVEKIGVQHLYDSFEHDAGENGHYRLSFESFIYPIRPTNTYRMLKIELATPGGIPWRTLPTELDWRSRMRWLFSAADCWPPEIIVGFGHDGKHLWFEFEDDVSQLSPPMRGSRWRARYDAAKFTWNLEQLCYLVPL